MHHPHNIPLPLSPAYVPCWHRASHAHLSEHCGEWQCVWQQVVKEATFTKMKQHLTTGHPSTPLAPPSTRDRDSYATYCAKRWALSKPLCLDWPPNSDPANIDTLSAKHPSHHTLRGLPIKSAPFTIFGSGLFYYGACTGSGACTERGGPEFEPELCCRWSPDGVSLRFGDCIFAPQSCECYGYLSSEVE